MSITVGKGVWDHKKNGDNVWNKFTRIDRDFPGESEVGGCHEAPNSGGGYDWSNTQEVWTYADDWLTYPQPKGVPSLPSTWTKAPGVASRETSPIILGQIEG